MVSREDVNNMILINAEKNSHKKEPDCKLHPLEPFLISPDNFCVNLKLVYEFRKLLAALCDS